MIIQTKKLYLLKLLFKVKIYLSLTKKENDEAMNVLFRKNFQIILLDILNTTEASNGISASQIQTVIKETENAKKPSLGTVVMSLARLAEKGLISFESDKISSRRKYVITLAGKKALREYLNSYRSLHSQAGKTIPATIDIQSLIPSRN